MYTHKHPTSNRKHCCFLPSKPMQAVLVACSTYKTSASVAPGTQHIKAVSLCHQKHTSCSTRCCCCYNAISSAPTPCLRPLSAQVLLLLLVRLLLQQQILLAVLEVPAAC